MYFQLPGWHGVLVWKITSIASGASTANRLAEASGVSGAGASASSIALVSVSTSTSVAKTMKRRLVEALENEEDDFLPEEIADDLIDFFTFRLLVRNPLRATGCLHRSRHQTRAKFPLVRPIQCPVALLIHHR